MTQQFTITTLTDIPKAITWCANMIERGVRGGAVVVTMGRVKRTLDQNAKLWPMLMDLSSQVTWFNRKLTKENWKDLVTASYREAIIVPNLSETGFVVLGQSTSKMKKPEFSDLIEYIYAFGSEKGVQWSEKAIESYEKYKPEEQAA